MIMFLVEFLLSIRTMILTIGWVLYRRRATRRGTKLNEFGSQLAFRTGQPPKTPLITFSISVMLLSSINAVKLNNGKIIQIITLMNIQSKSFGYLLKKS